MAIVKKKDTKLHQQNNEIISKLEEIKRKQFNELAPLKAKGAAYEKKHQEEMDAALEKNKFKINVMPCIKGVVFGFIVYFIFHYIYSLIGKHISPILLNLIPSSLKRFVNFINIIISSIIGVGILLDYRRELIFQVRCEVKEDKESMDIRNNIIKIQNKYEEETKEIKNELHNIGKGFEGEFEVSELIEKNLPDNYFLLNDVTIPASGGTTQIDHILITPTKIVCIETKSSEGKYYPSKGGWMWFPTNRQKYGRSSKGVPHPNPTIQANYHFCNLFNLLHNNGFRYDIDSIVVLTNPYSEYMGDNRNGVVINISELMNYLLSNDPEKIIISNDEVNKICDFLLEKDKRFSDTHYQKYENLTITNI